MGGNEAKPSPGLNISFIGESLYLFQLYLSRSIYTKSKEKKQKNNIFDFCNFYYDFNLPIDNQIKNIFNIYKKNKEERKLNPKEVLIVQVYKFNTLMKRIYAEMEKLEETKYMPLVLFLVDYKIDHVPEEEYYEEDLNYPEEGDYFCNVAIPDSPKIDENFIFISNYIYNKEYILESEEKELDKSGEIEFEKIKNILLRFYRYHNDLGDKFSIGKGNTKIKYDLTHFYHLNTFNICCIGRNGSGKSSFINYIFNYTKAKIYTKRESYTKKVNVHNPRFSNVPLKIFEIPGFNDNNSSISNAASKLTKLNKKLAEIKDELHLILYFFKSDELYMFKEEEYELIKSIPNEKNLKFIYIFSNSTPYTNKNEIMNQINDFIQKFLVNLKFDKGYDLFNKMKAQENNCIFVNFYPKENPFGVKELLIKLLSILKETNLYKSYDQHFFDNDEFDDLLINETKLRKIRAKKILLDNSIGNKVPGVQKGINLAVQKCAIFHIANIFGLCIMNFIQKNEEKEKNIKRLLNNNNFEIEVYNNDLNMNKKEFVNNSLKRVNVYYTIIYKGSGVTIGEYFPYEFCEKFIDELYTYFLKNIRVLSGSIFLAAKYLEGKINDK